MSKRPTENQRFSRLRLPMGWLRNAPIWSKLGLIMIVPTIATVVVGMAGLVDNINRASDADRARTLAGLTAKSGTLVHQLQDERADATLLLGAPNDDARKAFDKQTAATDAAYKDYGRSRLALANLPTDFRAQLNTIDSQLSNLTKLRQQIDNSSQQQTAAATTTLSNVVFQYQSLIQLLVSIRGSAAQVSGDETLGADMRAAASLAQAKEYLAEERVVVLQALLQRSMPNELRVKFIGKLTGQDQALQEFQSVAPASQRELFDRTVSGADQREVDKFQSTISGLNSDQLPADIFTPAQWDTAMTGKADLMRKVETALDTHVVSDAAGLRDKLQRQVLVETGLLLAMLLLAILFAWLVARSMARSLRELRHGALTVAQYGLPQAVARLRDPQLATQASPHAVAMQIAEPLPVRSRDEFGQVAEAFNAVHLEAVRTAAEQAALRASVATMFVNLARRSQILVDRLIGHLDRLERGEEDPDRLSELFQLDHLATRMRRNDENLLVLAGADSTRIQREPAPLMDVLRAAQSEVEHYTRIEFGLIDRDVEIGAHAVNDMVHLIAELLDNATAFSPPDSAVVVEARRVGDRAVLLVEDRGIGISPDQLGELNERLANPPVVDVAVSRMMGLVVVARLAARHGVKIELRPARERGTIADLTLPASVLVPRALAGRGGVPIAGSREVAGAGQGGGQQRSPFGPPLALESGPAREPGSFPPPPPDPRVGTGPGGFGAPGGGNLGAALNGNGTGTGPGNGTATGPGRSRLFSESPFGNRPVSGAPPANGQAVNGQPGNGLTNGQAANGQFGPGSLPGRPGRGGGRGPQPPAWSDLIGGSDSREHDRPPVTNGERPPFDRPGPARPGAPGDDRPMPPAADGMPPGGRLPQRRATESPSGEMPDEGVMIPRQRPVEPGPGGDAGTADGPVERSDAGWAAEAAEASWAPEVSEAADRPRPDDTAHADGRPADALPSYAEAARMRPAEVVPGDAAPVPGRPGEAVPGPGEPGPADAVAPPAESGPVDWDPASPVPGAAPTAPPAWPPVPQPAQPAAEAPQVPETFAAALDMTAEMPRVRVDWDPNVQSRPTPAGEPGPRFTDETVELPIFRELESAWFSTQTAAPVPAAAPARPAARPARPTPSDRGPMDHTVSAAPDTADPVAPSLPTVPAEPDVQPVSLPGVPDQPAAADRWRTSADEGWQAAQALAEEHDFTTTATGLPKRVPMSQLVPGGVEKGTVSAHKRTPEAVRGLLSAYHRGVQRGRSNKGGDAKTPEHTTAGPQSSQGGKEQQA